MINKMIEKLTISSEEATKVISTAIHQEVRSLLAGHITCTNRHIVDLQAIKTELQRIIKLWIMPENFDYNVNELLNDLQELIGDDNEVINN